MKDDELKRLEACLERLVSYEEGQKSQTVIKSDLMAHIETCTIKDRGYQEALNHILRGMEDLKQAQLKHEERLELIEKIGRKIEEKEIEERGLQKGKDKIVSIANAVKWIITTALALLGLLFWGKK